MLVLINNDTSYILVFNKLISALKVFAKGSRIPLLWISENVLRFESFQIAEKSRAIRGCRAVGEEERKKSSSNEIVNKLRMDKWEINY